MKNSVLIVDDNRNLAHMIEAKLKRLLSIDIIVCHNYATAKAELATHHQDIFAAILDVNLPDAPDGEVIDLVLKNDIPSIVITGSRDNEIREKIASKFITEYIVKNTPKDIDYAVEVVKHIYNNFNFKVLIVENTVLYRDAMTDLVKANHFTVFEAATGKEALELLKEHNDIRVVITDSNMPDMSGLSLIETIRERHSKSEVAILAVGENMDLANQSLRYGANNYFTKPFSKEIFYSHLFSVTDILHMKDELFDTRVRDKISGIYSREYFTKKLTNLYKEAQENDEYIALAIIEIDEYEYIYDSYGIKVINSMVQKISRNIKRATKAQGIAAKFSDSRFAIALPNVDFETVQKYFKFLQSVINKNTVSISKEERINCEVSIGIVIDFKRDLNSFIKSAEIRLEQAKENGKNTIIFDH